MAEHPDLTYRRYLDEVGWFLYHEEYGRDQFSGSYDTERYAYSRPLLNEVASTWAGTRHGSRTRPSSVSAAGARTISRPSRRR
jgi:hypothetical protein